MNSGKGSEMRTLRLSEAVYKDVLEHVADAWASAAVHACLYRLTGTGSRVKHWAAMEMKWRVVLQAMVPGLVLPAVNRARIVRKRTKYECVRIGVRTGFIPLYGWRNYHNELRVEVIFRAKRLELCNETH